MREACQYAGEKKKKSNTIIADTGNERILSLEKRPEERHPQVRVGSTVLMLATPVVVHVVRVAGVVRGRALAATVRSTR